MATSPICRCRVLYLGSSVPHITKDGLQGIQEPLRDLYPDQGSFSAKGIDSWLSVWSNGLLLENVDESMRQVTRFFNIETLHYCAAVRYVVVPGSNGERVEKFLPLDSPFARHTDSNHAPLFACILRRTAGIKVLECHAFICKKEAAANALVRCCFHSYADSMQAKHLEENSYYLENKRSRSMSGLNTLEKVEVWRTNSESSQMMDGSTVQQIPPPGSSSTPKTSNENGKDAYVSPPPPAQHSISVQDDDNYKVWTGIAPTERELLYVDTSGTMRSLKSGNSTTRSAHVKVRQMVGPPRPPPPPSPVVMNGNNKDHKAKTNKSKNKNKKKPKDIVVMTNGHNGAMNGYRPVSSMDPYGVVPPQHSIYGGSGLYTERRVRRVGRPPIPGHEEPIYIPSTRPLSPVSSYHPAAFPYEQYFMQYGTAPRNRFHKPDGKRRFQYMPHEYQPMCTQLPTYHPPPTDRKHNHHGPPDPSNHGRREIMDEDHRDDDLVFNPELYKRKGKHDSNKDDKEDSPFNTGIYKRKGHLNERAFSYSIRQEHRSRSNSLANLQFFSSNGGDQQPPSPSPGHRSRDEDRKERELAQLVSGLDLKENGVSSPRRMDMNDVPNSSRLSGESNFMRKKAPAYQR